MSSSTESTAYRHLRPTAMVWLLRDCTDPAGVFTTEVAALESRADLQRRLLCDYGPIPERLETITITTAPVVPQRPAAIQAHP
ncbi:MAG: hypothetical protein IPL94_00090 [Tetrasphaera sp.]|nr:hypothetical protein [Tetrasphaera sp.]